MNLGENIYKLRTQRNMSQGDLADVLDVSRQSVSKWENNSATPDLAKLIKLSEVFGITLDQLVGQETTAPIPQPTVQETVVREAAPPHRTVGIILLCFGLLAFLTLTLMGGFLIAIPTCLPFIICGIICMVCTGHLLFRCAWALFAIYLPVVVLFIMNVIGYRFAITLIAGILTCFAALLFWTGIGIRKGWLGTKFKKYLAVCVAVLILVAAASGLLTWLRLANSGLHSDDAPVTQSEEAPYITKAE